LAGLEPSSREHLLRAQQGDRGDGGALVYVFDTPDGSVFYQATSGHWSATLGGSCSRPTTTGFPGSQSTPTCGRSATNWPAPLPAPSSSISATLMAHRSCPEGRWLMEPAHDRTAPRDHVGAGTRSAL